MAGKNNFSLMYFPASSMLMVMLFVPAAMADYVPQETKITVYFHDYSSGGPNSTDLLLVGFPSKFWSFTQFGTVSVFDDLITRGPELTSPTVGRLQGIGVVASLDGLNTYFSFSIVFTNQAYNGSTIQIQGIQKQPIVEYGVVSGTGQFRHSRGYFTLETISFDASKSYGVFRANITIRH